jgi:uncharacterized membrane protein
MERSEFWQKIGWRARGKILHAVVPHARALSYNELSQISNWFETHVVVDPQVRHKWLALLPLAHVVTIFIVSRLRMTAERKKSSQMAVLDGSIEQAWHINIHRQAHHRVKLMSIRSVWVF